MSKKKILLGITGSIAAYKTPYLVRLLVKNGFEVRCVLTEAAEHFVTRETLQELSTGRVYKEMFHIESRQEKDDYHISLSQWADAILIAPATADTIAKIAGGRCEDLLSATVLSMWGKPVIIAPAMNDAMWKHPATRSNIRRIESEFGYRIISPEKGELACGKDGEGRLAALEKILSAVKSTLSSLKSK